jgi:hypothetical protein
MGKLTHRGDGRPASPPAPEPDAAVSVNNSNGERIVRWCVCAAGVGMAAVAALGIFATVHPVQGDAATLAIQVVGGIAGSSVAVAALYIRRVTGRKASSR